MSDRRKREAAQLGFNELLADAETENESRKLARQCAHLPGSYEEAVPFFRALTHRHHAAMLAADVATVVQLRKDAHLLATKLNNFEPGILAGDHAPGCMLDRATRAPKGDVPLWGQSGSFMIDLDGMRVRINMDGIFGLTWSVYHWLGFGAYAVDYDKPFLSETGFRSFIAINAELQPDYTPDRFAREIIAAQIRIESKGKLRAIKPEYRVRRREAVS